MPRGCCALGAASWLAPCVRSAAEHGGAPAWPARPPERARRRRPRAQTMRYAMIDKLRHPPPGFEEVVARHFRLCRHKVAAAARQWAEAAAGTGDALLAKRSLAAAKELVALLAAL